jgi:hypothetical protein
MEGQEQTSGGCESDVKEWMSGRDRDVGESKLGSLAGVKAVLIYRKKQVRQSRGRIGVQDKQSYSQPGPQNRNTREHPGSGVTTETATPTCECVGDKERWKQYTVEYSSAQQRTMGCAGTRSFWQRVSSRGGQPCHVWGQCWPALVGAEDVGRGGQE